MRKFFHTKYDLDSFVDHKKNLNLKQVKKIIEKNKNTSLASAAYFYLIGRETLDELKKLKPYADLFYRDSYNRTAVMIAAMKGRLDVLQWLKTEELSFDAKTSIGLDAVLITIANGEIETVKQLILPEEEGGFGLSLDVRDKYGNDPVFYAVASDNVEMFDLLTKSKEKGGYGLNNNVPLDYLAEHKKSNLLKYFLLPKEKGGLGYNKDEKQDVHQFFYGTTSKVEYGNDDFEDTSLWNLRSKKS